MPEAYRAGLVAAQNRYTPPRVAQIIRTNALPRRISREIWRGYVTFRRCHG